MLYRKAGLYPILLLVMLGCAYLVGILPIDSPSPMSIDEPGEVAGVSTVAADNPGTPNEIMHPVKIMFAGDFMFDRYVRQMAIEHKDNQFILREMTDVLNQNDLVVINLEGPITSNTSKSMHTAIGSTANYIFTFPPEVTGVLRQNKIGLVNIGNNHIYNFGEAGLNSTRDNLSAAGINYFGYVGKEDGLNPNQYQIVVINAIKLGFVNYNQFIDGGLEAALEDVDSLYDRVDILIVYAHWGAEYQPVASKGIQNIAHDFIDKGADIIIGSHPHVIQQSEDYNGKRIYYSLGNFVFDQYFDSSVRTGLLVQATINLEDNRRIEYREQKVWININGQTVPVSTKG